MKLKKMYADISKTEELDDGTLKVWGFASSEAVDSDGETIKADAIKAALPDYMQWANVREMHQAKAAGTAIEAEVMADGRTWFGAHVIDSEAVKKVKAGVYKGFSIGGKVTERDNLDKSVITGIKLVEVSLVDRPANPEAVFTMIKAEGVEEVQNISAVDQLAELLNKGVITPEKLLELAASSSGNESIVIEKSMWSVQDFAGVISTLGWLCQDAQAETDWEGDNSPVPAQLRAWFAQGIQIFKDMAAEEADELLASLKAQAGDVDVIEMAHRGADLAKAGAKFGKDAKEKLGKAHQAVKDAADHLNSLGYDKDDNSENSDKSAMSDDLQKMTGELAKVSAERDDLAKRLAEIEAEPAPGKALLKAINKGDDVTADEAIKGDIAPVVDYQGAQSDTATLIKFLHQQGGAKII